MSINKILCDLEKEFRNASESNDYSLVDRVFMQVLPITYNNDKLDERLTSILHKLRDDNILTKKQMIDYRARQVKYYIDHMAEIHKYNPHPNSSHPKNTLNF